MKLLCFLWHRGYDAGLDSVKTEPIIFHLYSHPQPQKPFLGFTNICVLHTTKRTLYTMHENTDTKKYIHYYLVSHLLLVTEKNTFSFNDKLISNDDGVRRCHWLSATLTAKQSPGLPLMAMPCLWIFIVFWNMSSHSEQNRVEHCDRSAHWQWNAFHWSINNPAVWLSIKVVS